MNRREEGQNTQGVPDVNPEADTASGGAPEEPEGREAPDQPSEALQEAAEPADEDEQSVADTEEPPD